MIISLDRFFVQALNESGVELDYQRLVEIYQRSREYPACKARRARNDGVARLSAMTPEELSAHLEQRIAAAREQAVRQEEQEAASLGIDVAALRRKKVALVAAQTRAKNQAKKTKAKERAKLKKAEKAKKDG
jgi:hypothetical protein